MKNTKQKMRIIIASIGVDPHDQGMKIISVVLRDAGMEVIYLGRFNTPETVVETAIQEHADIIGISDHMGSMVPVAQKLLDLLKEREASSIHICCGGLLSNEDIKALEKMEVGGNYVGGAPLHEIAEYITGLEKVQAR